MVNFCFSPICSWTKSFFFIHLLRNNYRNRLDRYYIVSLRTWFLFTVSPKLTIFVCKLRRFYISVVYLGTQTSTILSHIQKNEYKLDQAFKLICSSKGRLTDILSLEIWMYMRKLVSSPKLSHSSIPNTLPRILQLLTVKH